MSDVSEFPDDIISIVRDKPVHWNDEKLYVAWSRYSDGSPAMLLMLAGDECGDSRQASSAEYKQWTDALEHNDGKCVHTWYPCIGQCEFRRTFGASQCETPGGAHQSSAELDRDGSGAETQDTDDGARVQQCRADRDEIYEWISVPPSRLDRCSDDYLLVKTYTECEGVVEALVEAGIVEGDYELCAVADAFHGEQLAKCRTLIDVPQRVATAIGEQESKCGCPDDEQSRKRTHDAIDDDTIPALESYSGKQ